MQMDGANIALETLVWSALHNHYLYGDADNNAAISRSRLAFVRPWAKKVLTRFSSLRRFFYVEQNIGDGNTGRTIYVWLFTLSSDDGLVEEKKEARDLPVWSDI